MKKGLIIAGIFAVVLAVVGVVAEDKIPLEVRIKSVKGDVEVKSSGGDWEKAVVGMVLKEGAQVSSGYGAEAELVMADNSLVTVSQLTQIKIDKFFKEKTRVMTDLGLKIGKIRAKVQRVGEELSDFKVVTPTSVVSVRGTGMDVLETDRGTNVRSLEHMVAVTDIKGRTELVRPNQESNVRPGEVPTSVVVEMQDRAKVNTAVLGLTASEITGRHDSDVPEPKPGEPGKSGSVS